MACDFADRGGRERELERESSASCTVKHHFSQAVHFHSHTFQNIAFAPRVFETFFWRLQELRYYEDFHV